MSFAGGNCSVALPKEGQIVFVEGGVAQFRSGVFYSGMEEPKYHRPIQWSVEWWLSMNCNCGRTKHTGLDCGVPILQHPNAEPTTVAVNFCPPHKRLADSGQLGSFRCNCIACMRNERDELRMALKEAVRLLRRGQRAIERQEWEPGETAAEWYGAAGTFAGVYETKVGLEGK